MPTSLPEVLSHLTGNHWMVAAALLAFVAAWFFMQNRGFDYHLSNPTKHHYVSLLRAARMRSLIIIALLAMLIVAAIYIEHLQNIAGTQPAKPVATPITEATKAQPVATETFAPNAHLFTTIDIPEEEQLDHLKQRYEDSFVSYLYLLQCNETSKKDYTLLTQSLDKAAAPLSPPQNFATTTYQAAYGSYSNIYSDTPCEASIIAPILKSYTAFLSSITAQ